MDDSPPNNPDEVRHVDDQVIDLRAYSERRRREEEETYFTIEGGDGERSRFALPLWRAAQAIGADWVGIIRVGASDSAKIDFLFILDLAADPARKSVARSGMEKLWLSDVPGISVSGETVTIKLGEEQGEQWFLLLQRPAGMDQDIDTEQRQTLLFMAGESAGLLFHGRLAWDEE